MLKKGSPYAFQVLSDRAYGKLKETHQIEHSPYRDVSDERIEKGIKELQEKLGLQPAEPKILPASGDDPKAGWLTTSCCLHVSRLFLPPILG